MARLVIRAPLICALTLGAWLGLVAAQGGQIVGRVPEGPGCRVTYVYDGDTVAITCVDGVERTARVVGLDTPETKSPGCPEEAALGREATLRLRALVASGVVTLERVGVDKYRRALMRLRVDGRDVAETLVREGLAVRYRGGARPDWCKKLGA